MPHTAKVSELTDSDVIADIAALIHGARDVDGIEISDVEYDDLAITITLVDADDTERAVHLDLRP